MTRMQILALAGFAAALATATTVTVVALTRLVRLLDAADAAPKDDWETFERQFAAYVAEQPDGRRSVPARP